MAQPIVKYTLTKKGSIPEWLSTDSRAFAGQHPITGNKSGKIPRYESPQETIYLGVASGDPDPDGTPDDYVGIVTTKALLQTYITATGSTLQYKTTTETVTGIQTATTVGLATVWNNPDNYQGGLSTTTSTKFTASGIGTAVGVTTASSTSTTNSDTDGVVTRTDKVTTTETTKYETSYDYAAEATRLWDIYEAINS
jgi:hypothetical protein